MRQTVRVFLSHRSQDKVWTEKLARSLREQGVDAWLDKWEIKPGDSIVERIDEALTNCACLLLVLTPASVNASAKWVQTEWQSYLTRQLSGGQEVIRLIPLLLRETAIPSILSHIKYIDFRNEAEFDEHFLELHKAIHDISDRPALGMDTPDDVKKKIRLAKYQQVAAAMASIEEAAARLAGESKSIIPGENRVYPMSESLAMFRQAFGKLQELSRGHALFSTKALGELHRTVAMIETMNLDLLDESAAALHQVFLKRNLGRLLGERNRAFCEQMEREFTAAKD